MNGRRRVNNPWLSVVLMELGAIVLLLGAIILVVYVLVAITWNGALLVFALGLPVVLILHVGALHQAIDLFRLQARQDRRLKNR